MDLYHNPRLQGLQRTISTLHAKVPIDLYHMEFEESFNFQNIKFLRLIIYSFVHRFQLYCNQKYMQHIACNIFDLIVE